ncbi:MAG: Peptide chain release factor N(5)-glutamine methyltransferase [Rhodanobacteraceae bacterium]|jgi:release factor glutamine methyltransferase|nr:MAG: Peptide chain release factor N(5)-glutamine methyltransferase [Rhodanobacteraceae bacterium]
MMRARDLLDEGARALPGEAARREAALLLRHVLGVSDVWLIAHPDDVVAAAHAAAFRNLIERRVRGEPVAYLTGTRGFHDIELRVAPGVLIPRPETEVLVELALQRIPADADCNVADLGTGSGAIALAIARARARARVVATDASAAALEMARENAARLRIGNVEFRQGDWYLGLDGEHFDLVVSNPPYIAEGDPHLQEGDLRFEPRAALASGADGLDAIRVLVRGACDHLRSGGWLLLEHGFDQGADVRDLLLDHGFAEVFTQDDLEGRERATGGRISFVVL